MCATGGGVASSAPPAPATEAKPMPGAAPPASVVPAPPDPPAKTEETPVPAPAAAPVGAATPAADQTWTGYFKSWNNMCAPGGGVPATAPTEPPK